MDCPDLLPGSHREDILPSLGDDRIPPPIAVKVSTTLSSETAVERDTRNAVKRGTLLRTGFTVIAELVEKFRKGLRTAQGMGHERVAVLLALRPDYLAATHPL